MIRKWLRQALGIDYNAAKLGEAFERLAYLEQWIRALDEALWRVDLTVQAVGSAAASSAPAAPPPPDFRALAEQIRKEMSGVRRPFPTQVDDGKA